MILMQFGFKYFGGFLSNESDEAPGGLLRTLSSRLHKINWMLLASWRHLIEVLHKE